MAQLVQSVYTHSSPVTLDSAPQLTSTTTLQIQLGDVIYPVFTGILKVATHLIENHRVLSVAA